MKKILIALSAVALTSGVALANDFSLDLKQGATVKPAPFFNSRYGDAAPPVRVVVEPGDTIDYGSTAAIRNPDSNNTVKLNGPINSSEFDR